MFKKGYLSNICRTCNNERTHLLKIFEDKLFGNSIKIDKMLSAVSSIEINKADSLPAHICSNCAKRLEITYKFLTKYKKANKEINKLLKYAENLSLEKTKIPISEETEFIKVKSEDEAIADDLRNKAEVKCTELHDKPCPNVKKRKIERSTNVDIKILKTSNQDNQEKQDEGLKQKKGETKYICTMCEKCYFSSKALSLHSKIVHKNIIPHEPNKIEIEFIEKNDTAQLNELVPYRTKFFCEICNKSFQTNKALILHCKISHKVLTNK